MTMRQFFLGSEYQRRLAKQAIDRASDDEVMSLAKVTRTHRQNAKMHPMLADIQRQVPGFETFSTEDIKHRFLNALGVEMRFLPALEGEGMFPVGMRSSTLTVAQFSALVELIYAFGAKHKVRWSDPAERDQAA